MREIGTPKIVSHITNLHIKRPRITVNQRIGSRKEAISGSHLHEIADKKTAYKEGCLYLYWRSLLYYISLKFPFQCYNVHTSTWTKLRSHTPKKQLSCTTTIRTWKIIWWSHISDNTIFIRHLWPFMCNKTTIFQPIICLLSPNTTQKVN